MPINFKLLAGGQKLNMLSWVVVYCLLGGVDWCLCMFWNWGKIHFSGKTLPNFCQNSYHISCFWIKKMFYFPKWVSICLNVINTAWSVLGSEEIRGRSCQHQTEPTQTVGTNSRRLRLTGTGDSVSVLQIPPPRATVRWAFWGETQTDPHRAHPYYLLTR